FGSCGVDFALYTSSGHRFSQRRMHVDVRLNTNPPDSLWKIGEVIACPRTNLHYVTAQFAQKLTLVPIHQILEFRPIAFLIPPREKPLAQPLSASFRAFHHPIAFRLRL